MYSITIKRIDKDVPFKNREYKVTRTDEDGEKIYNYVYFDDMKDVEQNVYAQIVENLSLKDVIDAVNKEENGQRN